MKKRARRRYLLPAVVLGLSAVALPTIASSATPSISAYNEPGVYGGHYWMPSTATVGAGGGVKFSNPYTTTYHGLKFTGGSAGTTPSCTGIPQAASEPIGAYHWEGECTFSKPGTYSFICTVHPAEMKGTITVPGTPTATTAQPTEVTQTTATLNGAVDPAGNTTEYRFEYGTTTVSEHTTGTLGTGSEDFNDHAVSAVLTGLSPGVEYHVQLVATYGASTTVLGGEQGFTTPAPSAPTVKLGGVTGLKETEATLNGTVDPNGGEATEYLFEYGLSPTYGQTTAPTSLPTDSTNHQVSATLTKLAPGTLYYFKLVADDNVGGKGAEGTFTTASPSPEPTPEPTPTTPTPTSPVPPATQSSAPPPATTPAGTEPASGSPLGGGPSLRSAQHGSAVAGTLEVSAAGAGGRLEVDLLATRASLAAAKRPASVRVGRLLRSSVSAGRVSFAVKLDPQALRALRRLRHLALTVRVTLTPPHGSAVTVTRTVELRR